jgi:hypothetical protein
VHATDDLTCREFVELVTDYLENALSESLRKSVEAHLEVCDGCTLYLGQIRLTIRALHESRSDTVPPHLRASLVRRFRERPR